jgi:hypothetical protein
MEFIRAGGDLEPFQIKLTPAPKLALLSSLIRAEMRQQNLPYVLATRKPGQIVGVVPAWMLPMIPCFAAALAQWR